LSYFEKEFSERLVLGGTDISATNNCPIYFFTFLFRNPVFGKANVSVAFAFIAGVYISPFVPSIPDGISIIG